MAKSRLVRQVLRVYAEIVSGTTDGSFRFSEAPSVFNTVSVFLDRFEREFGSLTAERLVDFCICTAYAYRERQMWTAKQVFSIASMKRFRVAKPGAMYHEDRWLAQGRLVRRELYERLVDRSVHPQAVYVYPTYEEVLKRRCANTLAGYAICQNGTLGWTPLSPTCQGCDYAARCGKNTAIKYPELYRLRTEYGD
jgi:hypothetical protein